MAKKSKKAKARAEWAAVVEAIREESKRERFVRLINPRVNAALKRIQLVGNLAASQYEYSQQDIASIERALMLEVTAAMNRFKKHKEVTRFTIK